MNLVSVFVSKKFNVEYKPVIQETPMFKKLNESINNKSKSYENRKIIPTKPKYIKKYENEQINFKALAKALDIKNIMGSKDYDYYGYPENQFNIFDQQDENEILDYDSEVMLLNTYDIGKTYEDNRGSITYTITKMTNDKVWYIRNQYLHKFKHQEDCMSRTQFLEAMKFQPGEITETIQSMH